MSPSAMRSRKAAKGMLVFLPTPKLPVAFSRHSTSTLHLPCMASCIAEHGLAALTPYIQMHSTDFGIRTASCLDCAITACSLKYSGNFISQASVFHPLVLGKLSSSFGFLWEIHSSQNV